jgi:hypothetical protein
MDITRKFIIELNDHFENRAYIIKNLLWIIKDNNKLWFDKLKNSRALYSALFDAISAEIHNYYDTL